MLDDREQLAARVRARGAHHLADVCAARRHDRGPGRRRSLRVARIAAHPALHGAEVAHSRDDFLARVAAFVERHRVEHVEVQHLRDEVLDDRRADRRQTEPDLLEQRVGLRRSRELRCEGRDGRARADHVPQARSETDACERAERHGGVQRRSARERVRGEPLVVRVEQGGDADVRRHVDPDGRAQHEHREPLRGRGGDVGRRDEPPTVRSARDAQQRAHSAARIVPARERGKRGVERVERAAQLPVQERRRIRAQRFDAGIAQARTVARNHGVQWTSAGFLSMRSKDYDDPY